MKILIADDHALIRSGLRNELAELGSNVEFIEAWDAPSLADGLDHEGGLDLAMIDLGMPGMAGARTVAELRRAHPSIPLVVVSAADTVTVAHDVLAAGAAGFIPKSALPQVMLQAVRLVLAGGQYLPPEMLDALRHGGAPSAPTPPAGRPGLGERSAGSRIDLLSQRQREVFALLAKGLSNKMIARTLNVTEGTVKSHVATIFDVLNVHNRVSAVAAARSLAEDGG